MIAPLLLGLLLAYSGMLGFCLAMPRHWKQLGLARYAAHWRASCRPLGAVLLLLAGYVASMIWPTAMACVGWLGMVSLAGLILLLLAPYAPRLAMCLPAGVLPLGMWVALF